MSKEHFHPLKESMKSMQSEVGGSMKSCSCYDTSSTETPSEVECQCCICPVDHLGIVIHDPDCVQYKHETIIYPHEPEVCECTEPQKKVCACCACLEDECLCKKAGKEALAEWRKGRDMLEMPAVLAADHPLMQKFQATLRQFLERENQIALDEITKLKDELNECKRDYDHDLEAVYISDHDTNAQRLMIEEYESILAKNTQERLDADKRAKATAEKYKQAKEKLEKDMMAEREATEELEALTALCQQLEAWRDETDSNLTISHRMSEKMKAEKRALADEKRQLDMILYTLSNEVWSLESKLELFKKQMQIKNNEMNKVNDKVTGFAAELEDLDLDKKRLISLWNAVLANINQRDHVFDSVREDYNALQENYRTLISNLEITKKITEDEMQKSKELEMNKERINIDINQAHKIFETEDQRRNDLEMKIAELHDAIVLTEQDQNMMKMENQTLSNILSSTGKELDHRVEKKLKLENEILANLQDCLLNDKAVESMANGIKKMREMSRKLEISLMQMETQHARVLLDIEVHRSRQQKNNKELEKKLEKVKEKEQELEMLDEKYDRKSRLLMKKQRELDTVTKRFNALKEIYDLKSPQERRLEGLEMSIKSLREHTENLQQEWLRLQGHVVRLTEQDHKIISDINLINKQIQICDQKVMRIQMEIERVRQERLKVEKTLRELRGQLEVLERTRKEANDRNHNAHRTNLAITHEYTANLKDAESEILELEEEIEALDKEKVKLTQELDKVQREALVWQRKGILAVELKRNIKNAKSAAGEIGQMKTEIHRMEVRREQLRRTCDKLSEDLASYVTRRENALDKTRASAAVEKAHGTPSTSQSTYHHKLRLAKSDVARVGKELAEAKARLTEVLKEQERLETEVSETGDTNAKLEEHIASLLSECRQTDRQKQWLLERVVRSQRLGAELATAVKRQTVKVKKSKDTILEEFNLAKALNSRIKHIVDVLRKEYPYLEEKLEAVTNTLHIYTPSGSPRLTGEGAGCEQLTGDGELDETPVCQRSVQYV